MFLSKVIIISFLAIMFVGSTLASCDGDENAVPSECSNYCTQNCKKDIGCAAVCIKGCSCKPNFVYDDVVRRCVLRKNCSKPQ